MKIRGLFLCALGALSAFSSACGDGAIDGDPDSGADSDTSSLIDTDTSTELTDAGHDAGAPLGEDGGPDGGGSWLCYADYYGGGDGCDCGCGIDDPDCEGLGCSVPGCVDETCDYCNDENLVAMPCGEVPSEWTCDPFSYADGSGCDCGCTLEDPDCAGGGCTEPFCLDETCTYCHDDLGSLIPCVDVPDGWTCETTYYADGFYCDCGCGITDLDCGDEGCTEPECYAPGCDFCFDDEGGYVGCLAFDGGVGDSGV